MFNLKDKTAVVTGASGGIGGAIARALHDRGATVVLSGTREEPLQKLCAELGERTFVVPCNLRDANAIEHLAKASEEMLGHVDILVNNAGLTRDNLLIRLKDEDWQDVLDVNLTASFRLTRALVRGMMKRRTGRIINITSIVGVMGNAGQTNYAASKAGMIGFSKSLAQEVASRGVTVNCIAPGFIQTDMTAGLGDAVSQKILESIPMGRMGTSEEIASAAVYLASNEAEYMTGQTLHINGGMAMY